MNMIGNGVPTLGRDLTAGIQPHDTIDHRAEKMRPFIRADGDEVCTFMRVIVSRQAG
jgi:hypothetical protein